MMKDIAIYGAGGFGKEIACMINRLNEIEPTWNLIGFFDDNEALRGQSISHFALCLGGIEELNGYTHELAVVMAIGNPLVAKTIVERIINPNIYFPNLISPSFYCADKDTFSMGKGNIIIGRSAVSCNVSLGDFNVFNGEVIIGHDVHVGSFNYFMPTVRVSGEVKIGYCNFFGIGSIIIQQLVIGNYTRIAAGAVLMRKPKDGGLYIGNPAKIFKY